MIARLLTKACLACLLTLALSAPSASAGEPTAEPTGTPAVKSWTRLVPNYLCLCPPCCPKPCPPAPCWDYRTSCDGYCEKQLPCHCFPLRTTCDCYDCKPLPLCFPPAPCGWCCPRH